MCCWRECLGPALCAASVLAGARHCSRSPDAACALCHFPSLRIVAGSRTEAAITNSNFSGNTASGAAASNSQDAVESDGGGLFLIASTAQLLASNFSGNAAANSGGVRPFVSDVAQPLGLSLLRCINPLVHHFSDAPPWAHLRGGCACHLRYDIEESFLRARGGFPALRIYAGAVAATNTTLTLVACVVSGNTAAAAGGGVAASGPASVLSFGGVNVTGNVAGAVAASAGTTSAGAPAAAAAAPSAAGSGNGGGVWLADGATASAANGTLFSANSCSSFGGAAAVLSSASLSVTGRSRVVGNSALGGGAFSLRGALSLAVSGAAVYNNTAVAGGFVIFLGAAGAGGGNPDNDARAVSLRSVDFSGNSAGFGGLFATLAPAAYNDFTVRFL